MSDDSWITESVVQFTRSPMWNTPVNNFIDDHCWIFDEGEMKLRQTEVHLSFQKLVDDLLTNFVGEIGVSLEDVLTAVDKTVHGSSVAQKPAEVFLSYIFYVDDFRSFHTMMSKRNVELDILASRAMQNRTSKAGTNSADTGLEEADLNEDEALHLAIAASLKDEVLTRKEMEFADLQIQEALALSIGAENDRMRRSAKAIAEETGGATAQLSSAEVEQARKEKVAALDEERVGNIKKLEERVLEVRQEALSRGITATQVVESKSAVASNEKAEVQSEKPIAKITPPVVREVPKMDTTPPSSEHKKLYGLKPLPSIQPSFKQLEAMTSGSAKVVDGTQKATTASSGADTVDPAFAEMQSRAKYMREQREKIVAQNKANRMKELNDYSANKQSHPQQGENFTEEKQMTIDLARRLREDIVREATK